jgi:hypothetical protein
MNKSTINKQPIERLVAENVPEAIWLRLRRLTSSQLCRKLIAAHAPSLSEEVVDRKSSGMAWAVRSALGYWDTREGGLNSKILSRYYALLQISIAEQISSDNPKDDLTAVQRHTEYGHGLFSLTADSGDFPDNYYVGCLKSGHFPAYCQHLGLDIKTFAHERRPRKLTDADPSKLYSLSDLLCRVPELQSVLSEYLNRDPLSFHVGHASRNMELRAKKQEEYIAKTGKWVMDAPIEGPTATTYVAIYPHGSHITAEQLNSYGFSVKNIEAESSHIDADSAYFVGELTHPKEDLWWDHIETYKSGYSGTSLILPFWGMTDPLVLHLSILYAFSIVVRYLPETWHTIEHGRLDHIRALLEHYLVIVDNVLPKLAVERLTKTRLQVAQSGGLNAPI